ncbi:MAG: hypothetical protein ACI9TV_000417 [Sulfurimonas sp.]|jgi:uncharacterized protein involved in response to NO|uniref:NnrS family protein n=1 Tax=Sulfurimonas sp. TaxID=2022749 RepID=UPI0039E46086
MTLVDEEQNFFLSQPHQPFFILGIANALIMMLLFALSYKGILSLQMDTLNFHTYTLIFTVFLNVFTGFLFTTFSRFCQTPSIESPYYTRIFFTNLIGSVLFIYGALSINLVMQVGMLILLLSQFFIVYKLHVIFKEGQAADKKDAFWILVANYFGLFGHLLFICSNFISELQSVAINISFYLYLIFLTFAVAQRMIPFFSHSYEIKDEKLLIRTFVFLTLKTIFSAFDILVGEIIIDVILGLYLLREFISWKFTPLTSHAILWVLHLGLFWLPTALLLSAMSLTAELMLGTSFYFLGVHLIAIGFLTTILIGFGTRVTLGHSGQAPNADTFAVGLFFFIQVVVILRALLSFNVAFEWNLPFLFDISFSAWLVLFLLWGARYGKVLIFGTKM